MDMVHCTEKDRSVSQMILTLRLNISGHLIVLTLDIEEERYRSMMVEEDKYACVTVCSEPFRRSGSIVLKGRPHGTNKYKFSGTI